MNKIVFLLIVFCLISCDVEHKKKLRKSLPFFNSASFTPEWISENDAKYKDIHTISNFSFVNQYGNKITNETYKDKIYIADFFFTSCPGICPRLATNMRKLQEVYKYDTEVLLLSHSVTPEQDSIPVLKAYAAENKVNVKKWNLVTGERKAIYDLARKSYFADEDFVKTQDDNAFIHTENFVLIDKKGRIRGVYNGTLAIEVDRIIRHIKLLKKEG